MSASSIVSSGLTAFKSHKLTASLGVTAAIFMTIIAVSAFTSEDQPSSTATTVTRTKTTSQNAPNDPVAETTQTQAQEAESGTITAPTNKDKPITSPAATTSPVSKLAVDTPSRPPLQGYTLPAAVTEPGTFMINIAYQSAFMDDYGQVVAPFTIQRSGGYSLSMGVPETRIVQTPEGATGISCNAGFKDTDQGFIAIYGPDDAPYGTYACELSIKSGFITRVATLYFAYDPEVVQ